MAEKTYTGAEIEQEFAAEAREIAARGIRTGGEFKLVRKAAGLLAADVARLLGVTPESVSHWETGKHEIPRAVAFTVGELVARPKVVRSKLEALGVNVEQPAAKRSRMGLVMSPRNSSRFDAIAPPPGRRGLDALAPAPGRRGLDALAGSRGKRRPTG